MRKDPPGFIAQMKIMLAGLDQIKYESQIREQRREGRRAGPGKGRKEDCINVVSVLI